MGFKKWFKRSYWFKCTQNHSKVHSNANIHFLCGLLCICGFLRLQIVFNQIRCRSHFQPITWAWAGLISVALLRGNSYHLLHPPWRNNHYFCFILVVDVPQTQSVVACVCLLEPMCLSFVKVRETRMNTGPLLAASLWLVGVTRRRAVRASGINGSQEGPLSD